MSTNIDNLKDAEETCEMDESTLDFEGTYNLHKIIFDLSLTHTSRMKAFDMYAEEHGEEIIEVINRMCGMYSFSGASLLQKFLFEICTESNVDINMRVHCGKGLASYGQTEEEEKLNKPGYDALDILCRDMEDLPVPCQVDTVCFLMKCEDYTEHCKDYFCKIIDNVKIECEYRYRCILSLENKLDDKKKATYFTVEACTVFLQNPENYTTYRILSGQFLLLKKDELREDLRDKTEKQLLEFAKDQELDTNIRADAADVLLQSGSEERMKQAREIILELGGEGASMRTVYDNAQNVHFIDVESVTEVMEFLNTLPYTATYNSVCKGIRELIEPQEEQYEEEETDEEFETRIKAKKMERLLKLFEGEEVEENEVEPKKIMVARTRILPPVHEHSDEDKKRIYISLNRIFMDRALYTRFNNTLVTILVQTWSYLEGHESKDEMKKRMLQELVDMAGWCSTGYASRIVNCISGFGEFNLRITWGDQIAANLEGRLNACIRKLEDEDFKAGVLMEMNDSDPSQRKNFLKFFRENISQIRQEMWEEFRHHIDDPSYDMYFLKAVIKYEGYHM